LLVEVVAVAVLIQVVVAAALAVLFGQVVAGWTMVCQMQ
jgi:hypothetical protein